MLTVAEWAVSLRGVSKRLAAQLVDRDEAILCDWLAEYFDSGVAEQLEAERVNRAEPLLFWLGEHAEAPERLWPNDD